MDVLQSPQQPAPTPVYVPIQKPATTFGSIITAMAVGAVLAVTLLYMWGAEVARNQSEAATQAKPAP